MKKIINKLLALSLITTASLYATNGDNLIGLGAKSRAMGGTGVGVSHGAESALANGAMINTVEGTEITFGGFMFLPVMKSDLTLSGFVLGEGAQSAADFNGIPEVSIAHKLNDNWHIGIGMFGAAGMGVDYRDTESATGNLGMVTSLLLFKFAFPVAYTTGGLTLSVTPVIAWGVLDMNYAIPGLDNYASVGGGLSQTFGFELNTGMAYDFATLGFSGLKMGMIYHSSLEMEFSNVISHATAPFETFVGINPLGDILEQPAEYGIGFSYTVEEHTMAFDYRFVPWSTAAVYGTMGWNDANILALGYRYNTEEYILRFGFNYAKSVVQNDPKGKDDPKIAAFNMMNALGFPATGESHLTAGGTYIINEHFSIDVGLVYMPETTFNANIGGLAKAPLLKEYTAGIETLASAVDFLTGSDSIREATIKTTHQETSASFQLVFNF